MISVKERPQEFIDLLIKTYSENNSAYKTADKVGVTPYIVYSILKKNNIYIPNWKDEKPSKQKITGETAKELIKDYNNGINSKELSKKYNVGVEAVKNVVKRAGLKIRDHGGQRRRVTSEEEKEIIELYKSGFPQAAIATKLKCGASIVSRILINNGIFTKGLLIGEKHGSWKGGVVKKGEGYLLQKIYFDDEYFSMASRSGYVPQHRYIMAKSLGRVLEKHETVHHIDGNRENNAIENLQLRQGKHGKGVVLVCGCCGSSNIIENKIS